MHDIDTGEPQAYGYTEQDDEAPASVPAHTLDSWWPWSFSDIEWS